jgi:hypothetical protein
MTAIEYERFQGEEALPPSGMLAYRSAATAIVKHLELERPTQHAARGTAQRP